MPGQHRGVLCSIVQGDESAATSIVLVAGGQGRYSLQPCKHVGDKQDPQAKATSSMYHSLWVARSWSPEVEGAKTQQECRTDDLQLGFKQSRTTCLVGFQTLTPAAAAAAASGGSSSSSHKAASSAQIATSSSGIAI
jgi:hypothetical protein